MLDLLWLLLPVAAASGWLMARRSQGDPCADQRAELNSDYFRGLNFLLNEQPDKAIEVFIQMLEVDSDTAETHLALGNLFRRRGEVDRAIRIHQNLIARPTLNREQRGAALLELGQDYMRAGLLDRAESLLRELLEIGSQTRPALKHLLDIYQQEKEWDQAIEIARRLQAEQDQDMRPVIAQFYCELAEAALRNGDPAEAGNLAKRALGFDRACVRASLIQGRIAREAGQFRQAIRAFRRIEEQDIEFLPEVLPELQACFRAAGNPRGMLDYLRQVGEGYKGISTVLLQSELLQQMEGDQAAIDYMEAQLRRRPSVRGLGRLIQLKLGRSEGEGREDLQVLDDLVDKLLENRPRYQCKHCGFEGKSLHWQCPGCKEWNTVKPMRGVVDE
ncbi:lipopolysaccharide assembly protein LapB [Thiohalobacter sp. IOR34]|uniref:lipopolysaccharide assembly protein LapB n=1 Tax=Thiohalobacter sp. IOR34 TaxID=3057176 RepID=UPI0025B021F6|nr:lipopolysaccharide assembly protein LapB [Thiohalobacter sp. IOR34]WJW76695.1 lipopolysaccharide assembly protein LapB [Thiohalobacter sp. IOR34]